MSFAAAGLFGQALVAGNGSIWAAFGGLPAGKLARIDAATATLKGHTTVGWAPSSLAFSDGTVWVSNTRGDDSLPAGDRRQDSVSRIDGITGGLAATVGLEDPGLIVAAGQTAWVTQGQGLLAEVSATSPRVIKMTALPAGAPTFARFIAGEIFLSLADPVASSGTLVVIDGASGQVVRSISLNGAIGPALGAHGQVWLPVASSPNGWTLDRVSVASGAVSAVGQLDAATDVNLVTVDASGEGWAVTSGGVLYSFNPATGELVGPSHQLPETDYVTIAADSGAVWLLAPEALFEFRP